MKNLVLLFILIFTVTGSSQIRPQLIDKKVELKPEPKVEKTVTKTEKQKSDWSFITRAELLGNVDIYADKVTLRGDMAHSWLKFIIRSPAKWAAKHKSFRGVSYFLQYATANCETRRISRESTTFYNKSNRPMAILGDSLVDTYSQPVIPDSVDEIILDRICQ